MSSNNNKRYHFHNPPHIPSYHNVRQEQGGSSSTTAASSSGTNTWNYRQQQEQKQQNSGCSGSISNLILTPIALILCTLSTIGLITTLTLLYLTIRPFSIPTYRRLASNIGAAALLDAIALVLPNMRMYLSGDSDMPNPVGCSILVGNHCMEADWWAMLMMGRCVGLRGSMKAFLQRGGGGGGGGGGAFNSTSYSEKDGNGHYSSSSSTSSSSNNSPPSSFPDSSTSNHTKSKSYNPLVMSASAPILGGIFASASAAYSSVSTTKKTSSSSLKRHHSINSNLNNNNSGSSHNSPTNNNSNTHNNPFHQPSSPSNNSANSSSIQNNTTTTMSLVRQLLHVLLEFPVLSSENNQNYIQDRNKLFTLLRSFAQGGAPAPVHLLLFPEPTTPAVPCDETTASTATPQNEEFWKSMLAKSIECAKREGRPQLKHLLLPRTTGFYASLDSLRESSPVVYDVTMAYRGYHGEMPFSFDVSLSSLWRILRGQIPNEIHVRIKRYSMEEVLQDAQWLDKKWAEKDRLLTYFSRHQSFPADNNRGFCRHRAFDTKTYSVEGSITALLRLGLIPFTIPVILLLSIPLLWAVAWLWVALRTFQMLFPGGLSFLAGNHDDGRGGPHGLSGTGDDTNNGGLNSAAGTPFFPTTPFASPTHVASWRSAGGSKDTNSPSRR